MNGLCSCVGPKSNQEIIRCLTSSRLDQLMQQLKRNHNNILIFTFLRLPARAEKNAVDLLLTNLFVSNLPPAIRVYTRLLYEWLGPRSALLFRSVLLVNQERGKSFFPTGLWGMGHFYDNNDFTISAKVQGNLACYGSLHTPVTSSECTWAVAQFKQIFVEVGQSICQRTLR
jgi:hypothetical protein